MYEDNKLITGKKKEPILHTKKNNGLSLERWLMHESHAIATHFQLT